MATKKIIKLKDYTLPHMGKNGKEVHKGHPTHPDHVEHLGKLTKIAGYDPKVIADVLASYGVNGDTMLAHINPEEAALLKKHGG